MGILKTLVERSAHGKFILRRTISPDSPIFRKLLNPVAKLGDEQVLAIIESGRAEF